MYAKATSWALTASLLTTFAGPAWASVRSADVRFQPPGHTFSVHLPTTPVHTRRATSTFIGKIWTDIWGSRHQGHDYTVAITDLPAVAVWFNSRNGLFERARDKMLQALGARQDALRELGRGPFRQQLDYSIPERFGNPARRGRAWFALVDDKLVVVTAMVPVDTIDALDRHFDGIEPDAMTIAQN